MTRKWIILALVLSLRLLMGGLYQAPKAQSSSVQTIFTRDDVTPQEEVFEGTLLQGQVVPVQAGLTVELWAMDGRVLDSARTDVNGSYRFAPLPRGGYQLHLFDQEERELVLTQEARVSIKPKRRIQEYNLQLALSDRGEMIRKRPIVEARVTLLEGGISGQVTAGDTNQALSSVRVALYNGRDECMDEGFDARLSSTTTDANGMYSFTGLAAGSYDVQFRPNSSAEAYVDDRKDQIQVSDGNVTELNVALERGGQISGQIIADGSGAPLADVYVDAYLYDPDTGSYRYRYTLTDENGLYTTEGLASGEYQLSIYPSSSGGSTAYLEEYYNDQTSLSSATPVNVTIGQTTSDINASLALGGQIAGLVTAEDSGALLEDAYIHVYDADRSYVTSGYTDNDGTYTTGAVPTGNYRIEFKTYSSSDSANYISEYYNNKSTLSEADPIAVTVGNTTTNIDAQLALGGAISGLVTIQETSQPFYDVEVSAYDSSGYLRAYDWTDSDGEYDLTGLPPGTVYVRFRDSEYFDGCLEVDYEGNYYNQKPDLASANPLTVSSGQTIENINAVLSRDGISPPPPDTIAPILNMPSQLTRLTTSPDGAVVTYQITASDNVDPNPTVTCTPPSGSLFPMGATTVTCTATDASGNQASGSFTMMVIEASHQLHLPLVIR